MLKSLFEEQINHYIHQVPSAHGFPEADDYIAGYTRSNSVEEYLDLIRKAGKAVDSCDTKHQLSHLRGMDQDLPAR